MNTRSLAWALVIVLLVAVAVGGTRIKCDQERDGDIELKIDRDD